MVSRKYNPRKRNKKQKRPRALWANIVLSIGVGIGLIGFLLSFIICVDRVAEFLYNRGFQNDWDPIQGGISDVIENIPLLLYICFMKYLEASFATLLFFPLIVLIVPIYSIWHYADFSLLIYGYIPLFIGIAIALFSIVAGEARVKPDK